MATYLYTWNPARWTWNDLGIASARVVGGHGYHAHWSCGNTKRIKVGDRFLLMRLGVDPKGLLGCGMVTSEPYLLPHWDEKKALQGESALRTDLLFQALDDTPLIPFSELKQDFPDVNWTPQGSGTTVPEIVADRVFADARIQGRVSDAMTAIPDVRKYVEGQPRRITITTYDRSDEARRVCIDVHGQSCAVCRFNFGQAYGDLGEGYIEVHPLRPLAEIGEEREIDPRTDLRPVCANCHRMLHRRKQVLSIEELRAQIDRTVLA